MPGRIAVVDARDRFLRWAERPEIHARRLVHRSIHVLVFDARGRLVVQRRHPSKDTFPGCWDSSCAGHVEESDYTGGPDEDLDAVYAAVAARELEEELGIAPPPLEELAHLPPLEGVHYEQLRLFRASTDGPFRPAPDEVSEVRPIDRAGFDALVAGDRVTPTLVHLVRWLERRRLW